MRDATNRLSFHDFADAFVKALDAQNGGRIRNLSTKSLVCQEGGIAGDDFPELLERISAIYGTDFTDIPPYGGPEAGAGLVDLIVGLWRWWRGERQPDVSVGELYQAVKAGSWKEAFPDKVWPTDSD